MKPLFVVYLFLFSSFADPTVRTIEMLSAPSGLKGQIHQGIMDRVRTTLQQKAPELVSVYEETSWAHGEKIPIAQIIKQTESREKMYQLILRHMGQLFSELEDLLNPAAVPYPEGMFLENRKITQGRLLLRILLYFFDDAWLSENGIEMRTEDNGLDIEEFFAFIENQQMDVAELFPTYQDKMGEYTVDVFENAINEEYLSAVTIHIRDHKRNLVYAAHRVWYGPSAGGKVLKNQPPWLRYIPRGGMPSDLEDLPEFAALLERFNIPRQTRDIQNERGVSSVIQFRSNKKVKESEESSFRVDNEEVQEGMSLFSLAYQVAKDTNPQMTPMEIFMEAFYFLPSSYQQNGRALEYYVSILGRILGWPGLQFTADSALDLLLEYQESREYSSIQKAWVDLRSYLRGKPLADALTIKGLIDWKDPSTINSKLYNFIKFATGRKPIGLDKALDLLDDIGSDYSSLGQLRFELMQDHPLISYERVRGLLIIQGQEVPADFPESVQALLRHTTGKDVRYQNGAFRLWELLRVPYQTPQRLRDSLPDPDSMPAYQYLPAVREKWKERLGRSFNKSHFGVLVRLLETLPKGTVPEGRWLESPL